MISDPAVYDKEMIRKTLKGHEVRRLYFILSNTVCEDVHFERVSFEDAVNYLENQVNELSVTDIPEVFFTVEDRLKDEVISFSTPLMTVMDILRSISFQMDLTPSPIKIRGCPS